MNGPVGMYRMKPVVRHNFQVQLPDCMYKLKNIHVQRNGVVEQRPDLVAPPLRKGNIFDQNNQELEMTELQARQEQILQQLADLKKQMNSIKAHLKVNNSTPLSATTTAHFIKDVLKKEEIPSDITINASPTHPPYSLQLIQKLWQGTLNLNVQTYVHSSVSSLTDSAAALGQSLEQSSVKTNLPTVNVRLIWKNVGANMELIISYTHAPILGEVNLLRYLSRLSAGKLNYEASQNPTEIDTLLDICYLIVRSKTKTERANLLQSLHKSLGKSLWLGGRNEISVADVAAFSVIKQVVSANEINVGLGKWVQRCEAV